MPDTITVNLEIEVDLDIEIEGQDIPATLYDPPESSYAVVLAVRDPATGKELVLGDGMLKQLEEMANDWYRSEGVDYYIDVPPGDYD